MKIVFISPNPDHLRQLTPLLEARGHVVVAAEGGKSRMRMLAEQESPQLMLVDGICCDTHELAHVEMVTNQHPATAVVLLCSTHTPEFLLHSMRSGVREILPSPVSPEALQACVERIAAKVSAPATLQRGKLVAFVPCKGGSGTTFIATNLGWQLAQSRSVLLIDLNLQFGDALSFVHDGKPAASIADVARDISRLDASLLAATAVKVAPGFSILAAPEELTDAIEVKPEHVDAILKVAVTQYDFVLLDLGRNMDPVNVAALDRAQRIYVVMQSNLPDVRHTARLLDVYRSLGYPPEKIELLLNRYEKSNDISIDEIRKATGGAKVVTVPNAYREVSAAINHGDALAKNSRSGAVTRQLATIAETLNPQPQEDRGLLGRLFKRA